MRRSELIDAQRRLAARFGTATATGNRGRPHEPQPAELIQRVIAAAASGQPAADNTDIRSALALVAADRWATESREANLITLARQRQLPWREIAQHLGLGSEQAAQQRYQRLSRSPEVLIYAFRVAGEQDAPWHGHPNALPAGEYQTGTIYFQPAQPGPFSGQTLELRYDPVDLDCEPGHLRAYAQVGARRIAPTTEVQQELFGG
jgi:hypothetical protein